MRPVLLALHLPRFSPRTVDNQLPSPTHPATGYPTDTTPDAMANLLTRTAERRVLAWHPAQRAEVPV